MDKEADFRVGCRGDEMNKRICKWAILVAVLVLVSMWLATGEPQYRR